MLTSPRGTGLGFRLGLAEQMLASPLEAFDFIEVAPENYMACGGKRARLLSMAKERWLVVSHGLCGDFAGSANLDVDYIAELKSFLRFTNAQWYSDHLCLTHVAGAETHDLLPLPFTQKMAQRAIERIKEVQSRLDLPIAVENISAHGRFENSEMSETDFIKTVVEEAGCGLLLDVNNVYVNSVNFAFDPHEFIDALPLDRVLQIHVAGFYEEAPGLLIDSHGAPIVDPVFELLAYALSRMKTSPPILLERDNNFPPLEALLAEITQLREVVRAVS